MLTRTLLLALVMTACRPGAPLVIGQLATDGGEPLADAGGPLMPDAGACASDCSEADDATCDPADASAIRECVLQTDGCFHWVTVSTCEAGKGCWLGECRCEGQGCIRIDSTEPEGPFFEGSTVVLVGRNFQHGIGGFRLRVDGKPSWVKTPNADPQADSRLALPMPAVGAGPMGKLVRLEVENLTSSDWRYLMVYPRAQFHGTIDVNFVSSTPAVPVGDQPVELRFEISSRAVDMNLSLTAYDATARAPYFPILDAARAPISNLTLAGGQKVEVIVRAEPPSSRSAVVLVATNPGQFTSSGLVWLEPGQPTRLDASFVKMSMPYVETRKSGQMTAVARFNGSTYGAKPDEDLTLLVHVTFGRAGSYALEAGAGDAGRVVRSQFESATRWSFSDEEIAAGAGTTALRLSLARDPTGPEPTRGELWLRMRHVESGESRELRFFFDPAL